MGNAMIPGFKCDRCGHKWIPRLKLEGDPTLCPKCKSAYWNKPRRIDLAKNKKNQKVKKWNRSNAK